MSSRRVNVVFGLLCLLISLHVSDAVGQEIGPPEIPRLDASVYQRWIAAGAAEQQDCWSAASLHVGWMTVPNQIHVGYDGLVLPGACISSFFVYPLSGVEVGGSLPIRLTDRDVFRVYGSYLIANNPQAGQKLTWTNNPPGTREWATAIRSRINLEEKCCIEYPARRLWWVGSDCSLSLPTSAIQTRITSIRRLGCKRRPR